MESAPVHIERQGAVLVVTIDRPEVRNAVDGPTAQQLYDAFVDFDADDSLSVAILTGASGTFCAGADLGAIAAGRGNRVSNAAENNGSVLGSLGPMGPTRLDLSKPVIAAIDGYAVAGGLELALWCDLRVLSAGASLGVFCRRWGVPLIDGGTVRLTRVVGHGRAMDLILTGREVDAEEAVAIGLATSIAPGDALGGALALANDLAALPPRCMRSDRRSAIDQWSLSLSDALDHEVEVGLATIRSGETREGAARFAAGAGRHGASTTRPDGG